MELERALAEAIQGRDAARAAEQEAKFNCKAAEVQCHRAKQNYRAKAKRLEDMEGKYKDLERASAEAQQRVREVEGRVETARQDVQRREVESAAPSGAQHAELAKARERLVAVENELVRDVPPSSLPLPSTSPHVCLYQSAWAAWPVHRGPAFGRCPSFGGHACDSPCLWRGAPPHPYPPPSSAENCTR